MRRTTRWNPCSHLCGEQLGEIPVPTYAGNNSVKSLFPIMRETTRLNPCFYLCGEQLDEIPVPNYVGNKSVKFLLPFMRRTTRWNPCPHLCGEQLGEISVTIYAGNNSVKSLSPFTRKQLGGISVPIYAGNKAMVWNFSSKTCLCFRVNLLTPCAAMESANMLNLFLKMQRLLPLLFKAILSPVSTSLFPECSSPQEKIANKL